MNRTFQIRRIRGAAFLILVGVLALLSQWHILGWGQSWPLFLILAGVLMLAERAAWAADLRDQQDAQNFGTNPGNASSPYSASNPSYGSTTGPIQPPPPENMRQEER